MEITRSMTNTPDREKKISVYRKFVKIPFFSPSENTALVHVPELYV